MNASTAGIAQDGSQDPVPHRGIDGVLDAGLEAGERAEIDAGPQVRQGQQLQRAVRPPGQGVVHDRSRAIASNSQPNARTKTLLPRIMESTLAKEALGGSSQARR